MKAYWVRRHGEPLVAIVDERIEVNCEHPAGRTFLAMTVDQRQAVEDLITCVAGDIVQVDQVQLDGLIYPNPAPSATIDSRATPRVAE